MFDFDSLLVFVHIVCGTILVMTLVLMQIVVGPALANIPAGEDKKKAMAVIQGRWHPVVDGVIIVITITAILMLVTRWDIIGASHLLHIKVTLGIITLACANALHFYFRGYKRRLAAEGKTEQLRKMTTLTQRIEKVALVTGGLTFLLGLSFNHL